jgi:hypothetical protein
MIGLKGTEGQSMEDVDMIAENGEELNRIISRKLNL